MHALQSQGQIHLTLVSRCIGLLCSLEMSWSVFVVLSDLHIRIYSHSQSALGWKTHTESVHKSCSLGNKGVCEQHTRKDSCCKAVRVCVCVCVCVRSLLAGVDDVTPVRLQSRAHTHTLILALLCRCWWDCFRVSGGGRPIVRGSSHESGMHAAVCLWLRGGSGGHQLCRAGLSLRSAAGALFCL